MKFGVNVKFVGKLYKIHWDKISCSTKKNEGICRECGIRNYLANKTWSVHSTKNINNDKILYQSLYELDFIKWCNENKILIQNGPSLKYFWNKKDRTYYVDFYIPKLNILIELKDWHKFHIDEVKSGQWEAKENAVEKVLNEGIFKQYILLFKKDFNNEWKYNFLKQYNDDIV